MGFREEWQVHVVTRKSKVGYRDERTENTSLIDKLICNTGAWCSMCNLDVCVFWQYWQWAYELDGEGYLNRYSQ